MPDIQMVPMAGHTSQGDTYIDTDGMVDAAGNRFSLLGQAVPNAGNDTFATLRKIAPNGAVVGEWTFRPSANQKIDKANLLRSGQDVIVECITHAITSIKPRQLTKESGVVAGVFVTNPQFEAEEGGEGAWQPIGGQEIEVDYGRIEEIVNRIVSAKVEEWARITIANIIPKTKIGVEQLFDGANGSHVVYGQLRNTSYSGALDAIRDSRAGEAKGFKGAWVSVAHDLATRAAPPPENVFAVLLKDEEPEEPEA